MNNFTEDEKENLRQWVDNYAEVYHVVVERLQKNGIDLQEAKVLASNYARTDTEVNLLRTVFERTLGINKLLEQHAQATKAVEEIRDYLEKRKDELKG